MNPDASRKRVRRVVTRDGQSCPKETRPCPHCGSGRAAGARGSEPLRGGASAEELAAAAKAYAERFAANLHTELQALQKAAGLSVYKLAQRTGLDRQTLGPIVKGETKPTPHSMARIAYVLFGGMAGWGMHFDSVLRPGTEKRQP